MDYPSSNRANLESPSASLHENGVADGFNPIATGITEIHGCITQLL